jgi:hypothetical protein
MIIMNPTSLIQSLHTHKQGAFVISLICTVLVAWPPLATTAVGSQALIQANPQSAIRNPPSQTAFSYQGQLIESGVPATGVYDVQFKLYTAQRGGDELGSLHREDVLITNGLFKVSLDFGRAVTNAQETWLEIAVRSSGSGESYTVLSPRQRLTPTPYAILAQHDQWSLIGVPVGFAGGVDKDAGFANEVMALAATANFIPKYTGPNSTFGVPQLTDSVMLESGGNIAIGPGITTPAEKLDVAGNVKAMAFIGDGSALTGISDPTKVAKAGDTMSGPLNLPADGLKAGSSQLVLASSNVGIGTTTPEAKLDVRHLASVSPPPSFAVRRNFLVSPQPQTVLVTDLIVHNGNVGIGKPDPSSKLHVEASLPASTSAFEVRNLGAGPAGLFSGGGDPLLVIDHTGTSGNPALWFRQDGNTRAFVWWDRINNRLNLGTPTTNPIMSLNNNGNVGIGTAPSTIFKLDVAGATHATSFPTSSDARLKTNIAPLTNVLEKLQQIHGLSFDWNEVYQSLGRSSGRREIGVIAQEVEAVFPELVSTWGEQGYRAVDYGRLTAVLIEAVKELKAENEELKRRIEALERSQNTRPSALVRHAQ